ncbi:serine/threonine-protein kinase pim-3-like [Triplophysa rosa]|uniref:serine/threonine-protein kinase pim-3-like n=1 Tax=Triplophysa rosa TaxID=992332 RepID=UPI0025462731|nr:serine/threonine-protein kinase pim-3-like [Triplophysa rosa]
MWKAIKRPFCRNSSKTKTKQERVKKEKKKGNGGVFKRARQGVKDLMRRSRIRREVFFMRCRRRFRERRQQRYRHRRCPHHRCCEHHHSCPFRPYMIVLGVREQISSTVPSVRGPANYPQQFRSDLMLEEWQRKTQEQHRKEKKKGIRGFFKRTRKAVKRPETKAEAVVPDTPVPCASGLQRKADREQISSERPSVSVPSATESVSIQDKVDNEPQTQEQRAKEARKRTPLSVPPMFKPSDEIFSSLYVEEFVTLGRERFAEVFLATRKSDGQKVAVKRIVRDYWSASNYSMAGYMDSVMTEVAMMSLLKQPPISPYVIQMLEWFHERSDTYIVMEDPGPCTVLKKIMNLHPLGEKIARVIMRQAVQAAQHCIAQGVFHCKISPENILINTSTLDIKLIDFGYSIPYTGKKYYRGAGEHIPPEYEQSAITANVMQLGFLLHDMVFKPHDRHPLYFEVHKNTSVSYACKSLAERCVQMDQSKRPTLEQILEHRWFTQE